MIPTPDPTHPTGDEFPDEKDPVRRCELLAARVRVQNIIIDRLPRTADGEVILPGMTVYEVIDGVSLTKRGAVGTYIAEREVRGLELRRGKLRACMEDDWSPNAAVAYWSSRELAEDAAKGNRKAVQRAT